MTVFLKSTPLIAMIVLAGCNSVTEEMDMIPDPDPVSKTVVAQDVDTSEVGTLSVSGTAANPVFSVNGVDVGDVRSRPDVNEGQGLLANSAVKLFDIASQGAFFLYGETEGGRAAAAGANLQGPNSFTVSGLSRTGESELPLVGTAKYTGDYAGLLQSASVSGGPNDTVGTAIIGAISLDADLAAATLEGNITNRVDDINSFTFADVNLRISTADANGVHRGVTSGGRIIDGTSTSVEDGTYAAMLVGPAGENAVGTIAIEHGGTNIPNDAIEVGAFVAEQVAQ